MAGNKITCVHITPKDIRLLEGRINNGIMLITKTATVPKAARFFCGERIAYMGEMVNAIIDAMRVNSFSSKTLHLVYDNKVNVSFYLDEKLIGSGNSGLSLSKLLSTDITAVKKSGNTGESKAENSGTIVHKRPWGKYITENEKGELYTTVTMERDLVNFLVDSFQGRGYKIASLEVPETSILYLRKFVSYSYDALNKLIIYADDQLSGTAYLFTKDAPAGASPLHFDEFPIENFAEAVTETIKEEIRKKKLVNPQIMLIGDAFENPAEYVECCQLLYESGLCCIDTYGLWNNASAPLNTIRVITPNTGEEITVNGKFGICISLLIRSMEQKPENMIEGFHPMFLSLKTKRTLSNLFFAASILLALYGACTAGVSFMMDQIAKEEKDRVAMISENTLNMCEQQRDAVKVQVENLNTIDSRYNEIFKFIYSHINEDLNIASVDTQNMLPSAVSPESAYAGAAQSQTPTDAITGDGTENVTDPVTNNINNYTMQTIVIRGYARTSEGSVALYNDLVAANLGEVKIVGVEQVPLPSNETIFAFEMTVGIPV